jgi:hypothetical protein
MCDFAADQEAARQLLEGRVLTVERVRQLNAKDHFYQMLKDNPEMLKIYLARTQQAVAGRDARACRGVYVGTYCQPMIPSLYQPVADRWRRSTRSRPSAHSGVSSAATSARCFIWTASTECGFLPALLAFGIKEHEVRVMLHDNPAKLMWLD